MSLEKLAVIVQKCRKDPAFKRRLMADAKGVLAQEGILISDEIEIKVVEDTPKVVHLVLPCEVMVEISDADAAAVAGGVAAGAISPSSLAIDRQRWGGIVVPARTTTPPPH